MMYTESNFRQYISHIATPGEKTKPEKMKDIKLGNDLIIALTCKGGKSKNIIYLSLTFFVPFPF